MDIRNKKFNGYAIFKLFIILCLIALSSILFFIQSKTRSNETQISYNGIENLADEQLVINSPTLDMGTIGFYTASTNTEPVYYSQLMSISPDLNLTVSSDDTSFAISSNTSNNNSKDVYVDFSTNIVVPAHTEYKVKYVFTFTIRKVSSGGTATCFGNLYDYDSDKINAEILYNEGTDLDFNITSGNSYFVQGSNLSTNGTSTVTGTYNYTTTYTNKTKKDKEFVHNYGWCAMLRRSSSYASRLNTTLSIDAEIEAKVAGEKLPTNVEIEYTGQELSLADIEASQKTWYDADLMDIDYSDNADMLNAGRKKVKAILKDEENVFLGDYDENIGESDTIRYFDFIIKKKKIGVTITEETGSLKVEAASGAVYPGDTGERAPEFLISYKNTTSGATSDEYPTSVGTYTATVSISNECNYELDGAYTKDIIIKAKDVSKPDVGLKELQYNGEEQEFTVSGVSKDVKITPPSDSGMTYDPDTGILKVKDVGKYNVEVSLADGGKNTQWANNGGTSPFDIQLEITKATLTITFESEGGWSWNSNTEKTVSITDNRKKDTENLTFKASYDSTPIGDVSAGAGKTTNITIPKLSSKDGGYTLSVTLDDTGDGKNYTLGGITSQKFNITDRKIEVKESNIVWSFSNGSETKQLDSWNSTDVYEVTYNGKEFTFTAKTNGLSEADEVVIDKYTTQSGTNAGEYTTTVTLTSSKGKLTQSSFTLKWKINKAKFDLSEVKWDYESDKPFEYKEDTFQEVKLIGLPDGLSVEYEDNRKMNVDKYTASVNAISVKENVKDNYIKPDMNDPSTYICKDDSGVDKTFNWTLDWEIKKSVLELSWQKKTYEDKNSRKIRAYEVSDLVASSKIEYKYYAEADFVDGVAVGAAVDFRSLVVEPGKEVKYWVVAVIKSDQSSNYEIKAGTGYKRFTVGSQAPIREIEIESKFTYDGKAHGVKEEWKVSNNSHIVAEYYSVDNDGKETLIEGAPINAGKYVIKLDIEDGYEDTFELSEYKLTYEITKAKIVAKWNTDADVPVIDGAIAQVIEYEFCDGEGNVVEESQLEAGKTYKVKAKIKAEYIGNYEFVDENGIVLAEPTVTGERQFEMPNEDPTNPNNPENPDNNGGENKDPDEGSIPIDLGKFGEFMGKYWQPIVTLICIILILIFTGKGIGYASKRKKIKKTIEKKYSSYYALAGTGLFGLTYTNWTIVACIMMGVAVLSVVFMLLEKKSYGKAEEELDEAKEEYARNREETMYMRMMGGMNGSGQQGGYAYAQPMIGAEEIRGIVSETMTAMLPGMQQLLPQQASTHNDELVEKLLEKTTKNEEEMRKLIKKIADQPAERIVEREVAATSVSEEVLDRLASKLQQPSTNVSDEMLEKLVTKLKPVASDETILKVVSHTEQNDETIKQLLKNQEILMEKILELSANQSSEPQVVEKIVEVPVEKIVEKEVKVEVPVEVEKVVEKEVRVEVPVEKIVEKEVVKEVPVEKIVEMPVEVEKVVEKIVEIPAEKPAPKAKVTAPRLTLDAAYEKLSAKQKKIFDTLKAYAMSKDKCKEKKSTYYILLGQSSVNPLVKLTIKKDTTVALFKMEDEFMKDIRRNATNDGTKVKVKETELIVGDMQALATAKEMVDLREDQIERYNEYLREQRSMKKSK